MLGIYRKACKSLILGSKPLVSVATQSPHKLIPVISAANQKRWAATQPKTASTVKN
ncbi:unnamed protein product, partial [Oppiella nova]